MPVPEADIYDAVRTIRDETRQPATGGTFEEVRA